VLSSYVGYQSRMTPDEEMREELMRPYINLLCKESKNWLAYSKFLLQRSSNEFVRMKLKERSLLQVNTLVDQFRDRQPLLLEKIRLIPALNYPYRYQLSRNLAQFFMTLGVYMSAYELLKQVDLMEEAIKCLFLAGRETQAFELAQKILATKKTDEAGILCMLGDIKRDPSYYEQSWEASGRKFARAKRCMARTKFARGLI